MSVLEIILTYKTGILSGLLVTLEMCLIIWVVGIGFGTLIGSLGAKYRSQVGVPSRVLSFLLASIPVLVLLFWLHYPLQAMLGVTINPFFTAVFALTLINTFAVADIVRGSLKDFPEEYVLAGKVCGMSPNAILKKIQLPIITRQVVSPILTLQVVMLQATLFASLISVNELFRAAQRINSQIYQPIQVYTALAIFFMLICLPLNGLALWFKNKYTRSFSER